MGSLILKIALVVTVFAGILVAFGDGFARFELTVWALLQVAFIGWAVRHYWRNSRAGTR